MGKSEETIRENLENQIRFHLEKCLLMKKNASEALGKELYKPSLKRERTLGTEEVVRKFIESQGLERAISPQLLALYVTNLLKTMVERTLTDGRSRRIDDFFTVRLDMKGTAERFGEPFNPYHHKFTINFQKARRFREKSKSHAVEVLGNPVCEIPPSRSVIKNVHSQGAGPGEVYIGRQIILEGKELRLNPNSQVVLKVDYPVGSMMFGCDIVGDASDMIVVESPRHFAMKYMRESVIGLTGEVVLYLHDPRHRARQAAHGSRFKVKFVLPPKRVRHETLAS